MLGQETLLAHNGELFGDGTAQACTPKILDAIIVCLDLVPGDASVAESHHAVEDEGVQAAPGLIDRFAIGDTAQPPEMSGVGAGGAAAVLAVELTRDFAPDLQRLRLGRPGLDDEYRRAAGGTYLVEAVHVVDED